MRKKVNPDDFPELYAVLTLAQAVREYRIQRKNLSLLIDNQRIAAVRQGRNVLISRRSLENYLFPARR